MSVGGGCYKWQGSDAALGAVVCGHGTRCAMTHRPAEPVDPADADRAAGLLALLRAVAVQAPVGLLVFDTDLRYVLVNPQMAAMANTPAEQLLGRRVHDVFPDYNALTARVERVLDSGEPLVGFDVAGQVPGEDGRPHVWSLSAYRLVDEDGTVLGVAVTSTDVTAERRRERERAALARRLELLAAAGELLSGRLDERATVDRVLSLVVPAVAQWASVHLLDDADGSIRLAGARHGDPVVQPLLERVLGAFQVSTGQPFGAGRVIETGRPEDLPTMTVDMLEALAGGDPATLEGFLALRVTHGVVVPLAVRGSPFGALSLSLWPGPGEGAHVAALDGGIEFGSDAAGAVDARDELVRDVAARAAMALDNARLYARQREVAVTLQRSLLPKALPDVAGWDLAATYLPGAAGTEVGGDFYEAVLRGDGRLVFAIGDVMGRGVRAAAVMGQVRAALHGYALEGHPPAGILRRLNVMVSALEDSSIVTCLVGVLEVASAEMELACAGHVPPILATPTGCGPVPLGPGPPLGVPDAPYGSTRGRIPVGGALVAYTDGLVEARDQPVDDGIDALCSIVDDLLNATADPDHGPGATAEQICSSTVQRMGRGQDTDDDVAVLVLRRPPPSR
jgi:PAS domain S-box-containing protein